MLSKHCLPCKLFLNAFFAGFAKNMTLSDSWLDDVRIILKSSSYDAFRMNLENNN